MKADAALFGALLCILIAGTLTRAKTITEPGNQSRTYSSTEGTTVTTGTRLPITHFTTETSKGTTETPVKTTTTAASITIVTTTTHRQPTSESPQTITHLTTERTTLKTTTTKAPTTTPTTKAPTTTPTTTTPKTTTPKTTTPTTTTPKTTKTTTPTTTTPTTTPKTTTPTTTTTTIPTTATAVQSTVITPGVVTNHNGNPTTEQTGGSVFPVWPQTTTTTTTTTSPSTSSTTPKPTTSHSSGSTSSSHTTVTTTTTTHHSLTTSKTTTTTIPPTPTLPPNPTPPAKWWNVVYDSNGTNCMMIRFAAQIEVTYVTVDNRTVMTGFDIPANASVNSDLSMCNKAGSSEVFALNFTSHSVADGYLVAIFKKNAKTNASSLFELMVSYPITKELFPGISPKYLDKVILLTSTNLTQFETDPLHCYTCNSRLALNFTSIAVKDVHFDDLPPEFRPTDPSAHIFKQSAFVTRHLKIQTFLPTKKNMDIFMPGKLCEGDKPDTLWTVDFIVAVVMGALVALTLIIYYGVKKYKARNAPSEDTLPIVEE